MIGTYGTLDEFHHVIIIIITAGLDEINEITSVDLCIKGVAGIKAFDVWGIITSDKVRLRFEWLSEGKCNRTAGDADGDEYVVKFHVWVLYRKTSEMRKALLFV